MGLPVDIRLLIDRYVSEQDALGSRYGMLAYLLGFSDCKEKCLPTKAKEAVSESFLKSRTEQKISFILLEFPNKNSGEIPRRSVDQGLSTSPINDTTDLCIC